MVNRPKNIGTAGESALVKLLRNSFGFPDLRARRVTLSGEHDLSDVHAEFRRGLVAIEVKSGKMADNASLLDIVTWQAEAGREAAAANAAYPMLVVKRRGYAPSRIEHWRAFFPLLGPQNDREYWVEMSVHDALNWFGDLLDGYIAAPQSTLTA